MTVRSDTSLPPIGAVVAKRCTCGAVACHRENTHPRYLVVCKHPNGWLGPVGRRNPDLYADYHLERVGTGRRHRTSGIVLRDQYVILSLPAEGLLIS
jgi:hypothetical protein